MTDERSRCGWATSAPEYVAYHDDEWGRPLHGQTALFERLSLEAFQSGLSWLVILRKRAAFRAAFAGFDPAAVAALRRRPTWRGCSPTPASSGTGPRSTRPCTTPAGCWSWTCRSTSCSGRSRRIRRRRTRPATLAEVPATSPESTAMARELKRRGFRFVGPTTCYALMQAAGLVDDHVQSCWRAGRVTVRGRPGRCPRDSAV